MHVVQIRRGFRLAGLLLAVVTLACSGSTPATPTAPIKGQPPAPVGQAGDRYRVSNVTDNSFTVSWLTAEPGTGSLRLGQGGKLDKMAADIRGKDAAGRTHYVVVTGLLPANDYEYDVLAGDRGDDNGGAHFRTRTGSTLEQPPIDTVYGYVYQTDGKTPAAWTIVTLRIRDGDNQGSKGESLELTSMANDKGAWLIDMPPREPGLGAYFKYSPTGDSFVISADGADLGKATKTFDTAISVSGTQAQALKLVLEK